MNILIYLFFILPVILSLRSLLEGSPRQDGSTKSFNSQQTSEKYTTQATLSKQQINQQTYQCSVVQIVFDMVVNSHTV